MTDILTEHLTQLLENAETYVLKIIAQNPNTPTIFLEALAKDKDKYIRHYVAVNPNTPGKALKELLKDKFEAIPSAVAQNPNTPIALLEILAKHEDTRSSVARNPNTPGKILEELSHQGFSMRSFVAENPNTAIKVLEELSNDNNYFVRCHVAQNPNTPIEILEELSKDNDEYVRSGVGKNPNTPIEILEEFSKDKNEDIRYSVALNTNTPIAILENLLIDPREHVRGGLLLNPSAYSSVKLTNKLKTSDLLSLYAMRSTNTLLLEKLSMIDGRTIRSDVANNVNTSTKVLKKLSKDDDLYVRRAIAQNLNTPIELLIELSQDKKGGVRGGVASNIFTPNKILQKLSADADAGVRISVASMSNDLKILTSLAKDKDESVRTSVAFSKSATVEILTELAKDAETLVRAHVAKNPNTPNNILLFLAKDKEEIVRIRVAQNKKISMTITKQLAKDKIRDVRHWAIEERRFSSKTKKSLRLLRPKEVKAVVKYFELTDSKSTKFWEVEQKDSSVHLRWGKIGTNGQSKIKELDSKEDATKEVDKLIKQKTKKGYIEAESIPVYQEDKDKIKVSISNLKKKLSKYKSYCKTNNIKITGKVKKNIDSVNQLCKLTDKLSNCSDLYQKTKYDHNYLPGVVIYALDSAEIAWGPITKQCKDIKNIKREGDMFGCFPWTSKSYPWPSYKNIENKDVYMSPGIQIDLREMTELCKEDLGDGLLQLWFPEDSSESEVIRVISRKTLEIESPDSTYYNFESGGVVEVGEGCWGEMSHLGWAIKDYKMIGIQTDNYFFYSFEDYENELHDRTLEIASEISELMYEMHVNDTSFFGVPDPIQTNWIEFYDKGDRNLLSLSSKEYFCLGTDDTGQVMYKKEDNGEISFSFYWSHY
jgi:predicted DNA-binding WGR domain protein/3-methyladenine DNA glycosylase AlkC